ncbi:DUF1934 domain-containing protein [Thermohalobacter berrensis]|uniref:Calycin n=1 Tax=Thermohalobacter berrensis TaxID=99594 RepID=A0A419T7T1_9FIRM|nr:DUF1934 domain-containing protein [Thermohalobacter berrensis]RKD33483.1 calycin [Thermohalobacter berrensis]
MKEVTLKIKGTQTNSEGEENTIELVTEGKFYKKNDTYYIIYDESEISGMEGSTTTLKIEDDKVLMQRFGTSKSKLVFEKGKKHKSQYHTAYGNMDIEVITNSMDIKISDSGKGKIDLSYRINLSNLVESLNELKISIM